MSLKGCLEIASDRNDDVDLLLSLPAPCNAVTAGRSEHALACKAAVQVLPARRNRCHMPQQQHVCSGKSCQLSYGQQNKTDSFQGETNQGNNKQYAGNRALSSSGAATGPLLQA